MSATEHPAPSDRARELVRGGYDVHIHVAPDVVERRIDDVALARRFAELGLAGFGLKSVAVEIAAREGARIVWFPTVSSENEQHEVLGADPGGKVPVWVRFELELREAGVVPAPVPVVDGGGALVPEAHEVIAAIARHDLVLAAGHLARDEIFAVVDGAAEAGVRRIVVTHPEFPSQRLSIEDQCALAERGALMERAFTTPYTGKCSWEQIYAASRAVGPERTVWATDLGQVFNPPVEDGLALMADRFLEAGFTDEEVRTMAVANTRLLAGARALEVA